VFALSAFSKFYFRPGENERVETTVSLRQELRSAIHGTVRDVNGQPLRDALVILFEVMHDGALTLVGQMFTDEDGQFVFGPLHDGRLHLVKIYQNSIKPSHTKGRRKPGLLTTTKEAVLLRLRTGTAPFSVSWSYLFH